MLPPLPELAHPPWSAKCSKSADRLFAGRRAEMLESSSHRGRTEGTKVLIQHIKRSQNLEHFRLRLPLPSTANATRVPPVRRSPSARKRSKARSPSRPARRSTDLRVGFRSARSTAPRYVRWTPITTAKSSWPTRRVSGCTKVLAHRPLQVTLHDCRPCPVAT
jgi:hypothetical protein